MAAGFGLLRLSPDAFWSMTPREFAAAMTGLTGRPATPALPSRRDLAELMQRFPDQKGQTDDD